MTDDSPAEAGRGRLARKRGNGEGTITKRADGRYAGAVFVTRPDGTRGRKWIYGRTRAEVAAKLTALAQRAQSGPVVPTRSPTLSSYLDYWMTEVVEPKLRPTTAAEYRSTVELYRRPALGSQQLEKLTVASMQRFLNSRRSAGDSVQKLRMIRDAALAPQLRAGRARERSPTLMSGLMSNGPSR
jgi:hypothetical protein